MKTKVNDKSIWNEIYEKEEFTPGWTTPGTDPNLLNYIKKLIEDRGLTTAKMLDIGCGNGRNSMIIDEIKSCNISYTGADFADKAIEYCKQKRPGNKKFIHLDMTEDNLPLDNDYDVIMDCGCFHSIPPESRQLYINNIKKHINRETLYIIGAWYRTPEHIETKEPSYFPYLYLDEWFFNKGDITEIFGNDFKVTSELVDNEVYGGANKGFAYFTLKLS